MVVLATADALALVLATGRAVSTGLAAGLAFFVVCSRSFFSFLRTRRSSSSSSFQSMYAHELCLLEKATCRTAAALPAERTQECRSLYRCTLAWYRVNLQDSNIGLAMYTRTCLSLSSSKFVVVQCRVRKIITKL